MATVRFSDDLKGKIRTAANNKMQPAILRGTVVEPDASWGDRIYDVVFGVEALEIAKLPKHWFEYKAHIKLQSVNGTDCGLTFKFSGPKAWPVTFKDTPTMGIVSRYNDTYFVSDPAFDDLAKFMVERNTRIAAAMQRQSEFVDMVSKVIESYATLAPALKAWPPLWDLIPEETKDKHREVKERALRSNTSLDVDLTKLTALSTAAKLGV